MPEVEVTVHSYDETPCDSPSIHHGEPCGHGWYTHEVWVPAEPPC